MKVRGLLRPCTAFVTFSRLLTGMIPCLRDCWHLQAFQQQLNTCVFAADISLGRVMSLDIKCLPFWLVRRENKREAVLCLRACEILLLQLGSLPLALLLSRAWRADPASPRMWSGPGIFSHFYSHGIALLCPFQVSPRKTKKFNQHSLGKMPPPGRKFIL